MGALNSSFHNKLHIFQCMGKIFCVECQRIPLKFYIKYLTHSLKDTILIQLYNLRAPIFTSSYAFLSKAKPWPKDKFAIPLAKSKKLR